MGLLTEGNLTAAYKCLELVRSRNTVFCQPDLDVVAAAVPVGDVPVLKIPKDLGALAEGYSICKLLSGRKICCGYNRTRDCFIRGSGECQSVHCACFGS